LHRYCKILFNETRAQKGDFNDPQYVVGECVGSRLYLFQIIDSIFFSIPPPKYELRGAWIATVVNLDWPTSPSMNTFGQRIELISLLDKLKKAGINAVFFQVRTECDAFYDSPYEPWSYYLTGQQGRAPDPYYDPLAFAVEEAHKRGMELHAWFNPYRVQRKVGSYPLASNHVSKLHPEWVITIGDFQFLDPGIPAVREYVTQIVLDVVRRYDVDGVHFDDYFYPYPPHQITNEDDATFAQYSRGMTNKGEWRRENVNLLIQMIYDSLQVIRPEVKFGISPFGIWKNGVPYGIVGLDAYSTIYCDAVAWLNRQIVDYLAPQLYWPFGGGQDYGKLLPWWASKANGRHIYPGQAVYRIYSWSADEMPRQIRLNRKTANVFGSIFFRARSLLSNPKGFLDSLRQNYFRFPALPPPMPWKGQAAPQPPLNLVFAVDSGDSLYRLLWTSPDSASWLRFVVYRFKSTAVGDSDFALAENIAGLTGETRYLPAIPETPGPYVYAVTAVGRNAAESGPSNFVEIFPPTSPLLLNPMYGDTTVGRTTVLAWRRPETATGFRIEVATDSLFSDGIFLRLAGIPDTTRSISGLDGQTVYYWRVAAGNPGGYGPYSEVAWFQTGFPVAPVLATPENGTENVPVSPVFAWHPAKGAKHYRLQVARRPVFGLSTVADIQDIQDTLYAGVELSPASYYYWRVQAVNEYGESDWSEIFQLKTAPATTVEVAEDIPQDFELYQNYPNPFNAVTTIEFDLPSSAHVRLVVYDMLGHRVADLIDRFMEAGRHRTLFQADELSSGIYFYYLQAGPFRSVRKMTLIK
jgi:uncharacterized lipoprotein YddW (UPF0748 family)